VSLQVLYGVNQRLRVEDVDSPLCEVRPVKTVLLVVLTGDRGLCGGYNNFIIKKVRLHSSATATAVMGQHTTLPCPTCAAAPKPKQCIECTSP
jgi:F0F1-type ATP synthase gamma subunit